PLWPWGVVRELVEQDVRVGLEPEHLSLPARCGEYVHLNPQPGGVWAPPRRPQHVQAPAGGDTVEPGAQRRTTLEARESLPRGHQRLLQRVLGVLCRAEDPIAVNVQLPPLRGNELAKRLLVAGLRADDQIRCHCSILASRSSGMDTGRRPNWAVL